MKYSYKIVDKNTDKEVAVGQANSTLEVVKEFKLAYESQQHLKAVFNEL
jgi:hypothetical protein